MTDPGLSRGAWERFHSVAAVCLPYVESAQVIAVGVKSAGALTLIGGRIHLYRAGVIPLPEMRVETEHVFGRRQFIKCDPENAARLIEEASRGIVAFKDSSEVLCLDGSDRHSQISDIRPPGFTPDIRLPFFRVSGGPKLHSLESLGGLDTADWELRGYAQPYYGLDELMLALGLPTTTGMGDIAWVELTLAPPAVIADSSTVRDGRAIVRINASPKLSEEDVDVSVKPFPKQGTPVEARRLTFVKRERAENGLEDALYFESDIGENSVIRVFLTVRSLAMNQYWIGDPSRRLHSPVVGAEAFDENLAALDQQLFNPRDDQSERFEWAVGYFLHLLGFRVLRYGKGSPLTDGPDMLALTPSEHMAVVECTVGLPDNKDKIAKVIRRAAKLRDRLNKSGFPATKVLPIVITPLPRDQLGQAGSDAARRGVLVLDRDTLNTLRQGLILPQNADQHFQQGIAALASVSPGITASS